MKVEIIVPAAGESVTEADIASWSKLNGDFVEMDDVLLELETDKASMELNAETSGVLTIVKNEGETVQVGEVIGFITPSKNGGGSRQGEQAATKTQESESSTPVTGKAGSYAEGHPSPSAAKRLSEAGIDSVAGTGKGGRVTKADAIAAVASKPKESVHISTEAMGDNLPKQRREKMSRLRRTVADRLVNAQHTQALLTTFNEVDLTEVMAIRSKYKESFKDKYNVNLGFMSFYQGHMRSVAGLSILNASVDADHIVYNDTCDIGIAVASPKGLVVPVVRSAQTMSFQQIESAIVGYAKKARDGQISLDDMNGGTFTITNGGTFGSMLSTPIVNYPQSAILGMHNIVKRPMVIGDEIKIRPIMYLAVSYDHRIIDGADAVRFLVAIKDRLEDPSRLLIGL